MLSVNLAVSHAPLQASATSAFLFHGASRISPSSPHEGGSLLLSPTHLRKARRICVAVSAGLPRARPGLFFEETAGDDPFVFNIMIRVYSNSFFPVSAIHIYNHMREMGVGSDHFTFNFALKACARVMEQMEDGEKSYGFGMDRKGGEIHCRVLKLGKFNDGTLKLFREMQVAEVEAAEVTVISILGACAETGALEIGRKIHESLKHHKIGGCLGVALVDTYSKCGKLSSAWEVFSELKMKPVGCWDSMIMGLAVHGYCNDQRGSGIV